MFRLRGKEMRYLCQTVFGLLLALVFVGAQAASVTCNFMSETQITTDGKWLKSDMDFMKLYDIFGDGLVLPLENALLANLDSNKVFKAGETKRGVAYLMGGDMGVTGKLISVNGDVITIYDGMCDVSFGG
jgi:hypothetical protein